MRTRFIVVMLALVFGSPAAAVAGSSAVGAPSGGLLDGRDAFYGVLQSDTLDGGVIYRIGHDGADYRELRSFTADEGRPNGSLALGEDGNLYGELGGHANTLFSIRRDGSNYRTLYTFSDGFIQDSPVATLGDAVVIASSDPTGGVSIASVTGGIRHEIHRFDGSPSLRQLHRYGDAVYGVVQYRCTSEIFEVRGHAFRHIAGVTRDAPCGSDRFYVDVQRIGSELYALEGDTIDHIVDAQPVAVYAANQSIRPTLSSGSDGAFYLAGVRNSMRAAMSGTKLADCGSIVRVSADGASRTIYTYPIRSICPIPFRDDGPIAALDDGTVFGITPASPGCQQTSALLSAEDRACGSIYEISQGTLRVVHRFATAPASFAGIEPTTNFSSSGDRRTYTLTRAYYAETPVVIAPSPQPVSFINERDGTKHPLVMLGPAKVPLPNRPDVRGIGMQYRSSLLVPGMYRVDTEPKLFQRFYISENIEPTPPLRKALAYLALPGLVTHPIMNEVGETFAAAPLRITNRIGSRVTLTSTAGSHHATVDASALRGSQLLGLSRILNDKIAETATKMYAQKMVNTSTTTAGTCVRANGGYFSLSLLGGARVAHIDRIAGTADLQLANLGDATAFTAIDPLVVTFDVPLTGRIGFAGGDVASVSRDPTTCVAFYAVVADRWQLERSFAIGSRIDPTWPKVDRDAIARRTVITGMTRAMVAAAVGYPTTYGTIAELDKLDVWSYDEAAPFGSTVRFAAGVVTEYDPPGQLP